MRAASAIRSFFSTSPVVDAPFSRIYSCIQIQIICDGDLRHVQPRSADAQIYQPHTCSCDTLHPENSSLASSRVVMDEYYVIKKLLHTTQCVGVCMIMKKHHYNITPALRLRPQPPTPPPPPPQAPPQTRWRGTPHSPRTGAKPPAYTPCTYTGVVQPHHLAAARVLRCISSQCCQC